jgi:hypothetical protein
MKENENKEQSKTAGAARQGGDTNNKVMGSPVSAAVGEPVLTNEQIAQLNREAQDQSISGELPSVYLARAVEREVVARLAAPTQVSAPQADEEVLMALIELYGLIVSKGWPVPDDSYHLMTNAAQLIEKRIGVAPAPAEQASAAQEVRAVPVGYARQSELDKLVDGRVAGVGMMIHKEPGEGKVALYLAPVSTSTAPAAPADQIAWSHELQARLMLADDQGDDDLHNLLGEAACCLASLTGRPNTTASQPSLDQVTGAGKGEGDA